MIPDPDVVVNYLRNDATWWNLDICGNVVVELIHDGLSSEFLTHGYTYNATPDKRWVQLAPTKNIHVGVYNVKLKIKFAESDYAAVFYEVPVTITVLPCEIKYTETL